MHPYRNTLKAEEVYWRLYDSPAHARVWLSELYKRCNHTPSKLGTGPTIWQRDEHTSGGIG